MLLMRVAWLDRKAFHSDPTLVWAAFCRARTRWRRDGLPPAPRKRGGVCGVANLTGNRSAPPRDSCPPPPAAPGNQDRGMFLALHPLPNTAVWRPARPTGASPRAQRECAAPAATSTHRAPAGSQSRLPSQVSAVRAAVMVFGRSSASQQRPATAPASGSKSPPAATLKRKDTLSTLMANEPDDLSQLLSLDEDSVHDALRSRYEKRHPGPSPSPSPKPSPSPSPNPSHNRSRSRSPSPSPGQVREAQDLHVHQQPARGAQPVPAAAPLRRGPTQGP